MLRLTNAPALFQLVKQQMWSTSLNKHPEYNMLKPKNSLKFCLDRKTKYTTVEQPDKDTIIYEGAPRPWYQRKWCFLSAVFKQKVAKV